MFSDLPPWKVGALFRMPRLTNPTVGNTVSQIVGAEPMRYAIILGCPGGAAANPNILPSNQVSTTFGFQLNTTTLPLVIDFECWGPTVQQAWFGINNVGSQAITCIELILNFWPTDPDNKLVMPWDEDDRRLQEQLARDRRQQIRQLRQAIEQCGGVSPRWQPNGTY